MLGIIMDQPTPKISRKDIMRIVARDYPARMQEEVLEILRQYDGDSEKVGFDDENFTKTELKDIIKADWKQYQNWLKAK